MATDVSPGTSGRSDAGCPTARPSDAGDPTSQADPTGQAGRRTGSAGPRHQLQPLHRLDHRHPHEAGAVRPVDSPGLTSSSGRQGQRLGQRPAAVRTGAGPAPTGRTRPAGSGVGQAGTAPSTPARKRSRSR